MKAKIEQLIEKIIYDMWERPFAMTWETEARNMRKILKKHLESLQDTTEEREVTLKISDLEWFEYEWCYCKCWRIIAENQEECDCWAKIKRIP